MWKDLEGFALALAGFLGLGGGRTTGFLRATKGSPAFFLRRKGGAPGGGGLLPFGGAFMVAV